LDRSSLWWDFFYIQRTLEDWEDYLLWWGDWFDHAWWPLNYLAPIPKTVASWTVYAKNKIWLVYNAIIWVLDSIPAVPTLEDIRDWLRKQWAEVNELIVDPVGFIGQRIPRAYNVSPYIHISFIGWLSDWLLREAKPLYDLYQNPYKAILNWFELYNPLIHHLFTNWQTWLDDRVPKAYPWSQGFITNFIGWLDDWLRREWFDLWYAKTDFRQWLKTKLAEHLPDVYDLLFATDIELEELLSRRWGWAFDAFRNPSGYIARTLSDYYPETAAILAAPGTYIWCKLKEWLDLYVEEQVNWISRIAARVLNKLW
jgi:hypothetical protein